jgi:hypothetical protein
MKASRILAVFLLTFFLATILGPSSTYGSSIGFSLKLYGGLNYLYGGDLNEGLKGMTDYYEKYFWYFGLTKSGGEYNPVHKGMNFGGDFIIQFTPAVGIGFGAGYLQGKSESTVTFTPVEAEIKTAPKASAIPLRLGMYLTLPAGPVVNINFHAGVGYYLAKISYDFRTSAAGDWEQHKIEADATGLGYHGGIGLEFRLSRAVSLFFEGQGRSARIGGFKGSMEETHSSGSPSSENGKLYYYQYTAGVLGTFPVILVADTEPSGSDISNVREAKIDFSGFSAVAGIIIHF